MRVCHGLMTHPHNWVLFAKKIPKPHKQLIINGFLFAKKIPCKKLLVTLLFLFLSFPSCQVLLFRFYFTLHKNLATIWYTAIYDSVIPPLTLH